MFNLTRVRNLPLTFTLLLLCPSLALAHAPATQPDDDLPQRLRDHVQMLAGAIGERNLANHPDRLEAAGEYIRRTLAATGYTVTRQPVPAGDHETANFIVEIPGAAAADEIVVVGAHFDSARGTPGANDNASGVAAVLELARLLKDHKPARTLRFALFTNEEPPHFRSPAMGALVYAKSCHERGEKIVAMISLETIGYYSDEPGSQKYPEQLAAMYPDKGNFIGIVGNLKSKPLVTRAGESFRRHSDFPCETGAFPDLLPGVGWSDHWAFWQFGYQAIMFTDTAPFRYPHYHKPTDTPDKLDYQKMAAVVAGARAVVQALAADQPAP